LDGSNETKTHFDLNGFGDGKTEKKMTRKRERKETEMETEKNEIARER